MSRFPAIALLLFFVPCLSDVMSQTLEAVRGKTVMVVQAHPDDAESRCAGTLALMKRNGNKLVYVVCTRDDKGTYDVKANPETHAALRKVEEEAAVLALKVDVLEWLGYDDGWLDMVPSDRLRGDIVRLMRKYRPHILLSFDPRDADEHMDHRAAAFAAMDAATAAPFPLYYPGHLRSERLAPHRVEQIYYYDTPYPNTWVDIESTIETKIDALAKHVSQKGSDRAKIAADMRSNAQRDGAVRGMRCAESFRAADIYVGVAAPAPPGLRIGLSRTDITPPLGFEMGGYSARKGVSTGVHDPLTATVIYLENGTESLALVALDLRSFPSERVVTLAKDKIGVGHVLLAASHTHSGPITWEKPNWPTPEKPWFRDAEDKILAAIAQAKSQTFAGHLAAGRGSVYAGHNRRLINPDGSVTMFWRNEERRPTSPLDPTVRVLRIEDAEGRTRAVGVNYACHGVNLGPDNLEISADWPGYLRRKVEQELGDDVLCFFLQGAAGDINPYLDKQPVRENGFAAARETGDTVAAEVLRVLKRLPPSPASLESVQVAESVHRIANRWDATKVIPVGVSTVLIDRKIGLVAVPGEAFVELQMRLSDLSPVDNTFWIGYCYSAGGAWAGYLPTIRASAEGGYGAGYNTTVAVGAGDMIIRDATVNLLRMLGKLRDVPER